MNTKYRIIVATFLSTAIILSIPYYITYCMAWFCEHLHKIYDDKVMSKYLKFGNRIIDKINGA